MAAGKSEQNDAPVIDRGRVSYGDVLDYAAAEAALNQAKTNSEAMAQLTILDKFVERVIVSVPDSWFVDDAPESARGYSPGWLRFIRSNKMDAVRAAADGRTAPGEAEASATNS